MTRDRIALIVDSMTIGGAERVALNLAQEFVRRGLDVDLVLLAAKGPLLAQVPPEVRVIDLRCARARDAIGRLRKYLRSEKPEAAIAFTWHINLLAALARTGLRTDTKLLLTVHSAITPTLREGSFARKIVLWLGTRLLYPSVDRVVAVSDGAAQDLCRVAKLPRELVVTIHNPVIGPDFEQKAAQAAEPSVAMAGKSKLIVAAGRLTEAKDYPTLVSAFAKVAKILDARLLILGEGEMRKKIEALVAKSGLAERVTMPGHVENPVPFMKAADVFVMSSKREGFGNVLVEAMAAGAAVVSTDCPHGPREILEDGKWGRLVPVGDEDAMAEAILETLRSGGVDAKDRTLDFTISRAADKYLSLVRGSG